MQLEYTTINGRIKVVFEGKSLKDVFGQLAEFCEVMENPCTVGSKSSDKVVPRVREVDGNAYYELVCVDTDKDLRGKTLSFGQHKQGGTLFPKRKDDAGGFLPDNGWHKWTPQTDKK